MIPAAPLAYGPTPSARQLAWHELEVYGFVHFTVNAFTDKEWGYGDESPAIFNPSAFDADQIAQAARDGGLAGLILTCKHHDGFCLWPSPSTEHSIRHSPWRNGQGDMVKEIADACRRHGLKFGTYLSPWDRNHAQYGQPAYLPYYRKQLRELMTGYGELFEVWFDGANGGDGFYGGAREKRQIDALTYYDWANTWQIVRELQPNACMFSDAGPDIRWVGNENGYASDPCWQTIDTAGTAPGQYDQARLGTGHRLGTQWLTAECDVSIRPGWFYHAKEDDQVRTPQNLLELYFRSVGRGASLLLNLPPDRRGLVHENDVASLKGFKQKIDSLYSFDLARQPNVKFVAEHVRGHHPAYGPTNLIDGRCDTYWSCDDAITRPELVIDFGSPVTFNVVSLREHLPLGQRVDAFALYADRNGVWVPLFSGTSIGARRLAAFAACTTAKLKLATIGPVCPAIQSIGVHHLADLPVSAINRNN